MEETSRSLRQAGLYIIYPSIHAFIHSLIHSMNLHLTPYTHKTLCLWQTQHRMWDSVHLQGYSLDFNKDKMVIELDLEKDTEFSRWRWGDGDSKWRKQSLQRHRNLHPHSLNWHGEWCRKADKQGASEEKVTEEDPADLSRGTGMKSSFLQAHSLLPGSF